jgi:hypothetical protein
LRSLASVLIPMGSLLAIATAFLGVLLIPSGAGWIALVAVLFLGALSALRAGRMLRRLDRFGWREAFQAYAVALTYDIARALALVFRAAHRRAPVEVAG